jgi:hypothetical protein
MKKTFIFVLLSILLVGVLSAQNTQAGSVRSMTLNGSTGLILVPDARIAWEEAKFGLDFAYGMVWAGGDQFDHLPRVSLSLFKKAEITGLLQIGDVAGSSEIKSFVMGTKFQLTRSGATALALGGDFEFVNQDFYSGNSSKIYLAATYGGQFFNMPAVTTATIGWQFLEYGDFSSQFVYGMGFSLSLFPKTFKNFVYWITDFANFSYVATSPMVDAGGRGAFNTGVRIHPVKSGNFNLVIDVIGTDLLDDGTRGLSATVNGGFGF